MTKNVTNLKVKIIFLTCLVSENVMVATDNIKKVKIKPLLKEAELKPFTKETYRICLN